jgi:hypothetical protein
MGEVSKMNREYEFLLGLTGFGSADISRAIEVLDEAGISFSEYYEFYEFLDEEYGEGVPSDVDLVGLAYGLVLEKVNTFVELEDMWVADNYVATSFDGELSADEREQLEEQRDKPYVDFFLKEMGEL